MLNRVEGRGMIIDSERSLWVQCEDWKPRDLLGGYHGNPKRKRHQNSASDTASGKAQS